MSDFVEKREYFRINVDCDIDCKHLGSDEIHKARCVTLSGSGISFITTQNLNLGDELEVVIHPQHSITPPMFGHIKIIRILPSDDKKFEIGATMTVLHDH